MSNQKPILAAQLELKSSSTPSWKRMWVYIEQNTLKYSPNTDCVSVQKIPLDKATLLEKPETLTYRKYCFELVYKKGIGKKKYFLFSANSENDCNLWMNIIRASKSKRSSKELKEIEGKKVLQDIKVQEKIPEKNPPKTNEEKKIFVSQKKQKKRNREPMIGDYVLGVTLGEGSFGKVKLGTHIETGFEVALKFVDSSSMTGEREMDIMTCLNHENIVKLYDVFDVPEKKSKCLVLEYVNGGELFDLLLEHGALSEEEARQMFRQIISAIEYMHKHLIIHRDLKPENILLDKDRKVKITDFGLANIMKPGSFLSTHCGSMHYTAPEMHFGKHYIGPEVDLWSLGVVLFTMVTGCLPWGGDTPKEQLENLVQGRFAVPPSISKSCQQLLQRLLTVDPKKRGTIAEIRLHSWTNEGFSVLPISFSPIRKPLTINEIDNEILLKMKDLGFNLAEVVADLKSNAVTKQTVIVYYLMIDNKLFVELNEAKFKNVLKGTTTLKNIRTSLQVA